jgi:hypothetical protein
MNQQNHIVSINNGNSHHHHNQSNFIHNDYDTHRNHQLNNLPAHMYSMNLNGKMNGGSGAANGYDPQVAAPSHLNHQFYRNPSNTNTINSNYTLGSTHSSSSSSAATLTTNSTTDDSNNGLTQMTSEELGRLLNEAVSHMDLPPDKLKIVKMLPDEKKIQFLNQVRNFHEKQPPEYYIQALIIYTETMCNSKSNIKKSKINLNETSTELIKNLEVSLRTNRIEWVHKFLDPPLNGLDVLIDYLKTTINFLKENDRFLASSSFSDGGSGLDVTSGTFGSGGTGDNISIASSSTLARKESTLSAMASLERRHSRVQKDTRKRMNRVRIGEPSDDVHECVRCLRAIMNHQYGFHMIIGHKDAINSIALSLRHKEHRTRSLVLELLAAVCLVDGGHSIVLRAFDNFKDLYKETYRFESLMNYFRKDSANDSEFNIDFMVACMQFINIVVHSTQNMNFRVHLQYEFTNLGLDDYLENKLRFNESDRLQVRFFLSHLVYWINM